MQNPSVPWIVCPSCYYPIQVQPGEELDRHHKCVNPICPLSSNRVRVRLFADEESASQARRQAKDLLLIQGVKRFTDIWEKPVNYWGYFFCDQPVERFRLLEGKPLQRLMSVDFIADWSSGVAHRRSRAFTVFLVEYDRASGKVLLHDADHHPLLSPADPDSLNPLSPQPAGYCLACRLIREKCIDKAGGDPDFDDPCLGCNRRLVACLFDDDSIDYQQLRIAVTDPQRPCSQLFEALHHTCWAGLLDMAFPVMIADIMVAFVFTGQLRIYGLRLSEDHIKTRRRILESIGLPEERVTAAIEEMQEVDMHKARKEVWQELRQSAHELQTIATGRYGLMGAARTHLMCDKLRGQAQSVPILSRTKWNVVADIGSAALKELAEFFSFRQAAVFIRDAGQWKVAASWPSLKSLPISLGTPLALTGGGTPGLEVTRAVAQELWQGIEFKGYYHWVCPDEATAYLFTNRMFHNDAPRGRFNRFSQNLLEEATLGVRTETLSRLSEHQRIENIQDIIHNLSGPMSAIASAQARFDASVYDRHLTEMSMLPDKFSFLDPAITDLFMDIQRARRRVHFEISKFQSATEIGKHLKRRRHRIPLVDPSPSPTAGPAGLWDKVLWSFDMYATEMSARDIKLDTYCAPQAQQRGFLKIDRDALQAVLDNVVDNAVKYAYDGTEIKLRLYQSAPDSPGDCTLSIMNFGNGILPEERDRIGERMFRGTCSSTRRQTVEGTGLGMFIIKQIVEDYDGKVRVTSEFGGGVNYNPGEGFNTTVQISLPLRFD